MEMSSLTVWLQTKKSIDELAVCFYYRLNTGKEVIENI